MEPKKRAFSVVTFIFRLVINSSDFLINYYVESWIGTEIFK